MKEITIFNNFVNVYEKIGFVVVNVIIITSIPYPVTEYDI